MDSKNTHARYIGQETLSSIQTVEEMESSLLAHIKHHESYIDAVMSEQATEISNIQDIIARLMENMDQEDFDDRDKVLHMDEHADELTPREQGSGKIQSSTEEMDQHMLENQQQILRVQHRGVDHLVSIQEHIQETAALAAYLFTPLFIVLPTRCSFLSTSSKHRIFFLCGHGHRSTVENGAPTRAIHLARHKGYEVLETQEFLQTYAPYIVSVTHILKNGIASHGLNIPCLSHLTLAEGVNEVRDTLDLKDNTIQSLMNETISYLREQGYEVAMKEMGIEDALDVLVSTDMRSVVKHLKGSKIKVSRAE